MRNEMYSFIHPARVQGDISPGIATDREKVDPEVFLERFKKPRWRINLVSRQVMSHA